VKGHQANRPLISVIVPAFNSSAYLKDAVNSVLQQTYAPIELIVVDDGSTDATREILAGFSGELEYVYQPNSGIGAARNRGVEESSGEFLAFLDADDLWLQDKLRMQMDIFDHEPETQVVYGQAEQFCSPELDEDERRKLAHISGQRIAAPVPTAMLIRRQAFETVGPFDTSLRIGVEMEWYGRLCDRSLNMVMLDELLFRRRLHLSNTNRIFRHEQRERLLVLRSVIARRRNGAVPRSA